MIIGKPITFGSGGLMAEILCSGDVLSTDTITCTNGIKSYSAIWVTDHFVISGLDLGTYTVTATRGSESKSYEVLIDEIAVYEVSVSYRLYLYNEGDECEDVTGGWTYHQPKSTYIKPSGLTFTKEANDIKAILSTTATYCKGVDIYTVNKVAVQNYSKMCAEISYTGTQSLVSVYGYYLGYGIVNPATDNEYRYTYTQYTPQSVTELTNETISLSITNATESSYVVLDVVVDYNKTGTFIIHKVWLE